MAAVWRGVDLRLGRPVAVKILDEAGLGDPTAARRFDREARTVARLAHPNVVAVYDVGRDRGVAYLVMELVDGDSLAALVAGGPVDMGRAVDIAAQVCDALAAGHEAGVVHRDIKPANILLTRAGAVKVCDFGIARLVHAAQAGLTGAATAVGTSDYMAPEQAAGDPVDARADLYALGCVLYAMLTGSPPFTGDRPLGVLSQHLHRPAPPVRSRRADVPAALDTLVADLLAKDPGHRPASAGQVRARLAILSEHHDGASAAPAAASPASWPPSRAPVSTPTRTMPAEDPDGGHGAPASAAGGFRLGPVAAVAAGLAAVIVAALLTGAPRERQAAPPAASTVAPTAATGTTTTAPPATPDGPAQLVAALQAGVREQARAGQLDPDAATELADELDEISRHLAKGDSGKAAKKVAELRQRKHPVPHLPSFSMDTQQSGLAGTIRQFPRQPSGHSSHRCTCSVPWLWSSLAIARGRSDNHSVSQLFASHACTDAFPRCRRSPSRPSARSE